MHPSPRRPLEQILDYLHHFQQRATYDAVARVAGGIARGVMQGRPRDARHSWVVRKRDGLPSGYLPNETAPALRARARVISTGAELRAWLERPC